MATKSEDLKLSDFPCINLLAFNKKFNFSDPCIFACKIPGSKVAAPVWKYYIKHKAKQHSMKVDYRLQLKTYLDSRKYMEMGC